MAQPPCPQWHRPVNPGSCGAPRLRPKTVYFRETFFEPHAAQATFCFGFLTSVWKRRSHFPQRNS